MDALYAAALDALMQFLVKQAPGWVAAHPKTALATVTAYAAAEHAWPWLKARGYVRGNATTSVLFNGFIDTAKALRRGGK